MIGVTVNIGAGIDEKIAARLSSALLAVQNMGVRIGLPDSQRAEGLTLAELGLIQEFGIPGHIPARPFLSQGIGNAKAQAAKLMGALLAKMGDSMEPSAFRQQAKRVLSAVGAFVAGAVKKGITDGGFVKNAQSTEDRKGSTKPLIDTGLLRQSITWVLEAVT